LYSQKGKEVKIIIVKIICEMNTENQIMAISKLTILKLYTTKENLTVGSVGSVERMEKIQS
jgi:hypothetical protein